MSIRLPLLIICLFSLVACSSPSGRAPVSDLTLSANNRSGTDVASNSKRRASKNIINQKNYTVKKGDTLYSISWRAGVDINTLVQRNKLKSPYIIKKGQVLRLTDEKPRYTKTINNKSDLSSQNVNKNSNSACTAQNCNKNKTKELAQKKTKAYSANKVDGKTIAKKSEIISNKKVSDWSWPVKGKLSTRFSASQSGMQGISIVNKRGTSVQAASSGKVVYAGSGLRGYGNLIIIKHNYDYLSAYAHNETLLVRENEQIKVGQKIAVMGDSGSDHVNLHFEIRYRGKSVDPLRYLPKR
ncbi:peptidoglycan DD-metalloendopeptidase family protein [Psychromonas sp. Urea-02u-13]|uniref:peptidoglycan DD-metalloendopeptidase family protein n=1 Tax=Psychromonas sp. Urea-02u-13 TaxID=2058326 RepID=UPI000C323179|nr:peptidoglycan DD-metalloendopeptidase family protein [Psychromonas sp. Urea-02u-13]PKG38153.1 peptidase M23 [Psychromonas sp. Urea-02u-13]